MIGFYNWLVCKLFKRCQIDYPAQKFQKYCEENPWADECKIYED
jgi:hypothetical protein